MPTVMLNNHMVAAMSSHQTQSMCSFTLTNQIPTGVGVKVEQSRKKATPFSESLNSGGKSNVLLYLYGHHQYAKAR